MKTIDKNITIKHKGIPSDEPCLELECLQKETNNEIQESQRIMTGNQESIKQTLETMNISLNTMNGTINRNYDLYQKMQKQMNEHEKIFHQIDKFMVRKDTLNGVYEKETEEAQKDIDEINRTRIPILERLTAVEQNKADKKDVNEVLLAVQEVSTTLKTHCENDNTTATKKDKKYEMKITTILQIIVLLVMIFSATITLLYYLKVI